MRTVQRCMALAQLFIEQKFPAIVIYRQLKQEERYVISLTFSLIVYYSVVSGCLRIKLSKIFRNAFLFQLTCLGVAWT